MVVNGNNRFIEIYSTISQKQVLRIEKKGDTNLIAHDFLNKYIVYSDLFDTQVF